MDELFLKKITDMLLDVICVVDAEGHYTFISGACKRIFGYSQEELIGRNMIDLVLPDDRARTLQAASEVMNGKSTKHFENRYLRKDGRVVDMMWSAHWSQADGVRLAVGRDITELKRAARLKSALYEISEAAHAAEDLGALYSHVHAIIAELLPTEHFSVARYDESSKQLSFHYFSDGHDTRQEPGPLSEASPIAQVIRSGKAGMGTADGAVAADTKPGDVRVNWLGAPLLAEAGVIGALVVETSSLRVRFTEEDKELLRFVSDQVASAIERKESDARLQHMARHDPLTDLPNRTLVKDRFETAVKQLRREKGHLGVLYLDLNDFKRVNDTYGHHLGDLLLREVAARIASCVREADTVGRLGGDEFVVILNGIRDQDCFELVSSKIRDALAVPFNVGGNRLTISASIGCAKFPDDGDDWEQLFRRADETMYAAKRRERI